MIAPTLVGDVLVLDALRPGDVHELVGIEDEEVRLQQGRSEPTTAEQAAARIAQAADAWSTHGSVRRWAIRLSGDPALIGLITLRLKAGSAEVEVSMGPAHRKDGTGGAALTMSCDHALRTLRCRWVSAYIRADDAPSIRMIEGLGGFRRMSIPSALGGLRVAHYRALAADWMGERAGLPRHKS